MPGPYPLATLACTIDAAGISAPVFEDILASLQASYQQTFGADAYIAPDSQPGIWLAILAQAQYDHNQADIAAYQAYSPAFAQGVGLSSIVKINGLRRLLPTSSSAALTLTGVAGIEIVSGIVSDTAGNYWALPPLVVMPTSGAIVETASCQAPGAINAAPATIQNIVNPQAGWQSATNLVAAIPGAPVESDAALRQRQSASTGGPAQTPLEAITAAIANLAGVERLYVYQNDTDAPDANGIPGHSIAAVVAGGDVTGIAQAIASKKSEGTGTFGTVAETVIDQNGVPDVIYQFPLSLVPVCVSVTVDPLPGFLSSTNALIQAAIAAYLNGIAISVNMVYLGWLRAPADLAGTAAVNSSGLTQAQLDVLSATYVVTSILIGPSATLLSTQDMPIAFYAAPQGLAANITVTIS